MNANFFQTLPGGHCFSCHRDFPDTHDYVECKTMYGPATRCTEKCKDSKFYGAQKELVDKWFNRVLPK